MPCTAWVDIEVKVEPTVGILVGENEGTRNHVLVKFRDLGRKREWETAQVSFVEVVAKAARAWVSAKARQVA
jgi:hypothetical protein